MSSTKNQYRSNPMRKALATVGLLVLSFIPAPSFSHGNEKYSACELHGIVSGMYGGKAANAIFVCWDPNDPDVGIGIGGIPDMEPMEKPIFERPKIPSYEPSDYSPKTEMPIFERPKMPSNVPMEKPIFDRRSIEPTEDTDRLILPTPTF